MKKITYHLPDGQIVKTEEIPAINRQSERMHILKVLRDTGATYIETNVRRKTADDIYAGRQGQAI